MLKQNMAALMNRIATGAIAQADLQREIQAAIDQLRPYVATEPWVSTMMTNFERQIRLINRVGVAYASRGISGIAANNAAVLATNRGVAMMSQDIDDSEAHTSVDMFSTPAQRIVSGGIVRGVSGPGAPVPVSRTRSRIFEPMPRRSGISGSLGELELDDSIPPPPRMRPLPLQIPPPPTLEELESSPTPPRPFRTRGSPPSDSSESPPIKRARVTFDDDN